MDDDDVLLAEQEDDAAARSRPRRRGSLGPTGSRRVGPLVAAALLVGVAVGVHVAGQPVGQPPPGAPGAPGAAAPADRAGGQAAQREAELTAALADDPDDLDARLELGVIAFNAGRLGEARAHWEAVTGLAPDHAGAWHNLGFYHLSVEPPDEAAARAAWTRVVEIDPTSELAQTAFHYLQAVASPPPAGPAEAGS